MDMEPIEEYQVDGKIVRIFQDLDPESPREWDNLGTMTCFHREYMLGDKATEGHQQDAQAFLNWLRAHEEELIALPLFLYDHSGLVMSTDNSEYPFSDRWDAGQVGYIYVERVAVREEWGWKRISLKRERRIRELLRSEVETYNQWLRGDVYGYVISERCPSCNRVLEEGSSCWGYFGMDWIWEELKSMGYPKPE